MSKHQTRYMCKPCGEVFTGKLEASDHAKRHRSKAYNSVKGERKVTPDQLIREIEVEVTESEEQTLYEIAGSNPPDETESRVLADLNGPTDSREATLWEYE